MKTQLAALLLCLTLSACDEQPAAIQPLDKNAQALLTTAKAKATPFEAYKALSNNDSPDVVAARLTYLSKAVSEGSVEALDLLYKNGDEDQVAKIDPEAKLLITAINKGEQFSPETYLTLGAIYDEGKYAIRNTLEATEMYSIAWLKGSHRGAYKNYALFSNLHEPFNAYLWALRASQTDGEGVLVSSPKTVAENYIDQGLLTPADVIELEKLSLDKSVIYLSNGTK